MTKYLQTSDIPFSFRHTCTVVLYFYFSAKNVSMLTCSSKMRIFTILWLYHLVCMKQGRDLTHRFLKRDCHLWFLLSRQRLSLLNSQLTTKGQKHGVQALHRFLE